MRVRGRILIVILAGFLLLGAGVAGACFSKTAVEGLIVEVDTIDAGDEWMDDAGVMHGRNGKSEEILEGDLEETLYVNANYDLDLNFSSASFGDGKTWGTLKFVGTLGEDDVSGIYIGVWGGPIEDFFLDVKWIMKGFGGFRKSWLKVDNYGPFTPPGSPFIPQVYEGYVISK